MCIGGCVAAERKTGKFGANGVAYRVFSIPDGFEKRCVAYRDQRKYNDLSFSKTVLKFVFSKSDCRDEFRERRAAHASLVISYAPKRWNNLF
jgi:hypothetical protein